ncbi:Pyridoxine/pyridoxamine 5'-phosphate oxidase 2 [Castilleja foliolosa]|uniref:Pyridoxine/pyridoxamine 5'-phosphate oxidase 2 n=1 Tax=Castilleja foliolosa TaxID=1961234 RepID=A0ABD3BRL6_9LAMI
MISSTARLLRCWYFTESWEQFRISRPIDVIDGTNPDPVKLQQREKSWFACSVKSRMQYMAPTPRVSILEQPPAHMGTSFVRI